MVAFPEDLEKQAGIIYNGSKFQQRSALPVVQIRLLSLHPSTNACSPLIGDLTVRELYDPSLQFAALSYVWGDESVREQMVLNGVNTTITRNLAEALRCLQSEGKANHLWADAVCIYSHQILIRDLGNWRGLMFRILASLVE
jgi:hypothetical protein